jgi:hypothetical protein
MQRFLARLRVVVQSFAREFLGFVLPFVPVAKKFVAAFVVGAAWLVGWAFTDNAVIGVGAESPDRVLSMNPASLIAITVISAWALVGIGYAVARTHRAKLVVADELELDEENNAFRLVVGCAGFGEVQPIATVTGLKDANGAPFHAEAVVGLRLQWTHRGPTEQVTLSEESGKESFTVLWVEHTKRHPGGHAAVTLTNRRLCVYGVNHVQPIDHRLSKEQKTQLWIKVRVTARRCEPVEKWYSVASDPESKAGYRPSPIPDPPPAFCA